MSAFEVTDVRTHEYRATNSMSASRLPMALSEVPFNIAIVTEDFLIDTASFGGETGVDFSGGANRDYLKSTALMEACYRSQATGQVVGLTL